MRPDPPEQSRWRRHLTCVGGLDIFMHKLCRLIAVLALTVLFSSTSMASGWTKLSAVTTAALIYCTLLASANVFVPAKSGLVVSFHLTVVSLLVCAVYIYRDLWPLLTFNMRPKDEREGVFLWIQVTLMLYVAVVGPLFEPYPYTPIDPKDVMLEPNPEQTASILSLLSYSFIDRVIWYAYGVPHLKYEELPPLADYDYVKSLNRRGYPYLDPFSGAKRRSLFWGLVLVFRRPLAIQSAVLITMSFARLAGPAGLKMLLDYLERGYDTFDVKPWLWIVVTIVGPLVAKALYQYYIFLSTASAARAEAIITSLVFDHSLRIRLKTGASAQLDAQTTPNLPSESISESTLRDDASSIREPEIHGSPRRHSRQMATPTTASASAATVVDAAPPFDSVNVEKSDGDGSKSKGSDLVGKINNLVTSDMENIIEGRDFLFVVLNAPLQIILSMAYLYLILGWSSIVGFVVMIALFPMPAVFGKSLQDAQTRKMQATDARVQSITETMNVLRMVKLFGWEARTQDDIATKREEELKFIWKAKILVLMVNISNYIIPLAHMVATYAAFTLLMKRDLSASIVFSSLGAFNMLRSQFIAVFREYPRMIQANVSLHRVADFLRNTELLDEFDHGKEDDETHYNSSPEHDKIGMGRAHFTWSHEDADGTTTPSRQTFRLRIEDELTFLKGKFNIVIGSTGSGKTSVLMALLGEMHYIPLGSDSWVNLPRHGGVAYAAQESWVQNETIKDNILFGTPYDEQRYKKVIYQCGLKRDLALLDAGDATEVGEKGLTLSGGQKARITLARAIYSPAEILLLDDVLAALDVHTSRWIVDECFKGDLVRDRTLILVTHNVALVGPLADFVVSLGADGSVNSQGSVSDAFAKNDDLADEMEHELEAIELEGLEDDLEAPLEEKNGTLVVAEEIAEGRVSRSAYGLLLDALGGKWPILFWIQYLVTGAIAEALDNFEMWWLGYWARQYAIQSKGDVSVAFYLSTYSIVVCGVIVFHLYSVVVYTIGSMRASRLVHARLLSSLLASTFRWLDITPISRIITRCTQDMQAFDGEVALGVDWLCNITTSMVLRLAAVLIFAPSFVLPAIAVAVLGGWLGQVYMKAQLSVKREMSVAKAPVLGLLGGALNGLPSIRAYNAQAAFKQEIARRIDRYLRTARSFFNINRWISVRIDALSAIFSGGLAVYMVYGGGTRNASTIGFVLNMAASFSDTILLWVRTYNEFELSSNSLERISQYITIEQEPKPMDDGVPPAYWPASGALRVEKLSARYSPEGPLVLRDITFEIKAGERVGIVGRTGSGKSSLTLSLLRCIYTEGTVYYDGLPTDKINLDALRSNITIIPQVPELLSGTLRQNLDVFGQYDDATLNDALRAAGLFTLQSVSDENRLGLDSRIASGGGNLSVGQRQIIALARAIVRQSKLLILDEATSAIDYETDTIIQSSLRNELKNDVTVITVAHRLQTIMDSDKIMVLDAGTLVEFDTPSALLGKEGLLRALVDESADKDALFAMAEGKAA